MHEDRFQFNRGAIRPLQALAEGWRLIKSDYWFFVGVCFVGVLIAQMAPLNILLGPAMCGIHICLLRQANGQKVKFDMLYQGFNYFGLSCRRRARRDFACPRVRVLRVRVWRHDWHLQSFNIRATQR